MQNLNLKVDTGQKSHNIEPVSDQGSYSENQFEDAVIVPTEPKITDKKFIQELSSENIETLALEIIGGNGHTIKFQDIYEYSHFLGKGGFGYVVSAIHKETDKPVALKVSFCLELPKILIVLDC